MLRRLAPLAVAAALVVGGCGSDNPELIPQSQADELESTVDQIAAAAERGDCDRARREIEQARTQREELSRRVDADLKRNIDEWLDHIESRLDTDCEEQAEESPTATETPEETETPTPTPTQSPEETQTPTVTPDATEPPGTGGVSPGDEG